MKSSVKGPQKQGAKGAGATSAERAAWVASHPVEYGEICTEVRRELRLTGEGIFGGLTTRNIRRFSRTLRERVEAVMQEG